MIPCLGSPRSGVLKRAVSAAGLGRLWTPQWLHWTNGQAKRVSGRQYGFECNVLRWSFVRYPWWLAMSKTPSDVSAKSTAKALCLAFGATLLPHKSGTMTAEHMGLKLRWTSCCTCKIGAGINLLKSQLNSSLSVVENQERNMCLGRCSSSTLWVVFRREINTLNVLDPIGGLSELWQCSLPIPVSCLKRLIPIFRTMDLALLHAAS